MKRFLTLLIVVLMLVSLVACNEKTANDETAPADTEAANIAPSGGAVSPTSDTFEELTVVDNDDIAIRITELVSDDVSEYTVKAYVENKTDDKTLTFVCDRASVNGVEVSVLMYEELTPGENAVSDISIDGSVLEKYGITVFSDIELRFAVKDENDYENYLFNEKVHVYPYGEEAAAKYEREATDTDITVLDNEYVTVIYTGAERDEVWENVYNFIVVNKSDKDLTMIADTVLVNGCDIDPIFAPTVSAGNVKFDYMAWLDEELEENGIESIEKIEFEVYATDADDLYSDELFRENVTLDLGAK